MTRIRICRDNPAIVYAIGANNALIKSETGGDSWYALTGPSATDGLEDIYISDENHIIIANDDGEFWESSDGGVTWAQQAFLTGTTHTAGACVVHFASCGCGVVYCAFNDLTAAPDETMIFRNVDNGANERWHLVNQGDLTLATDEQFNALVCCGPNLAVALGGDTTGVTTNTVVKVS